MAYLSVCHRSRLSGRAGIATQELAAFRRFHILIQSALACGARVRVLGVHRGIAADNINLDEI
jgi:hypothetical protein